MIRTAQAPLTMAGEIELAVQAIDKDQPVSSLTTVDSLVDETFALPRFNLTLVGVFSFCALALVVAGVFAQVMHSVTERTHEIGIRIALGAQRGDVVRMVLRDGAMLAAAGVAIGAMGAAAACFTSAVRTVTLGAGAYPAPPAFAFGQVTAVNDPRSMQIAMRLRF